MFKHVSLGLLLCVFFTQCLFAAGIDAVKGKTFKTSAIGAKVAIGANQGWNIYAPWEVRRTPDRMITEEEAEKGRLLSPDMSFEEWAKTAKATWVAMIEPKPIVIDYSGGVYNKSGGSDKFAKKRLWNSPSHPEASQFKLVLTNKYYNSNYSKGEPKWIYEFKDPNNSSAPPIYYVYKDVEYKWEFQKAQKAPAATYTKKYKLDYDYEKPHYVNSWEHADIGALMKQPWDPGVAHDGDSIDVAKAEKALFHTYVTLTYKRAQVKLGKKPVSGTSATSKGGSGSYKYFIESIVEDYRTSSPSNDLWVGGFPQNIYTFEWGKPFQSYNNEFGGGKSGLSVLYLEDYKAPDLKASKILDLASVKKRILDTKLAIEANDNNPNNPKTKISFEYTIGKYEVYYDDVNGDGKADPNDPEDRFVMVSAASSENPTNKTIYFGKAADIPSTVAPKRIKLRPDEMEKLRKDENHYIKYKDGNYWVSLPEDTIEETPDSTPQNTKTEVNTEGVVLPVHSSYESDGEYEIKTTTVKASDCCGNVSKTTSGPLKPHDDVKPNTAITISHPEEEGYASEADDDYEYFVSRDYYVPNGDSIDLNAPKKEYSVPSPDKKGEVKDPNGHYYGRWVNDDEEWTPEDNYTDSFGNNLLTNSDKFSPPVKTRIKFVANAIDNNDRAVVNGKNIVEMSYIKKHSFWLEDSNGNIVPNFEKITKEYDTIPHPWKPIVCYYVFHSAGTYYACYEAFDAQDNRRFMKVRFNVVQTKMRRNTLK